jgi:hypothetical protein
MLEALTTKKGYEELTTNHADAVADVIRPGDSAGDVVMRLLLKHPNTVEAAYSRFCLNDRRQLHCFKAAKKFNFTEPSEEDWNEIEKDLAQQIAKFFMRHSAYLTLRSYHSWRNIVRPPEKEAPAKRSRTEATPTTSAHGGFYQSKGVTQPDFILPRARASVPHACAIGSLPPTSWSPAFISPSTQLVIRGSPVGEVACPSLVPAKCG